MTIFDYFDFGEKAEFWELANFCLKGAGNVFKNNLTEKPKTFFPGERSDLGGGNKKNKRARFQKFSTLGLEVLSVLKDAFLEFFGVQKSSKRFGSYVIILVQNMWSLLSFRSMGSRAGETEEKHSRF